MDNPTKHSALSLAGTVIVVASVLWLTLCLVCIAGLIVMGLRPGAMMMPSFFQLSGGGLLVGWIALMIGREMESAGERRQDEGS